MRLRLAVKYVLFGCPVSQITIAISLQNFITHPRLNSCYLCFMSIVKFADNPLRKNGTAATRNTCRTKYISARPIRMMQRNRKPIPIHVCTSLYLCLNCGRRPFFYRKSRGRGRGRGRARGRPPSHQTMMRRQAENQQMSPSQRRPRGRPRGSGRRGRPPTRTRFVDDRRCAGYLQQLQRKNIFNYFIGSFSSGSSSSSNTESSDGESAPAQHRPYSASPVKTKAALGAGCMNATKPAAVVDSKKRFSDKSSKIPDSVYFGDVDGNG